MLLPFVLLAFFSPPSCSICFFFFCLHWTRHTFLLGTFTHLWKKLLKALCQMFSCLATQRMYCQVYVQRIRQNIQSPLSSILDSISSPAQPCLRRCPHRRERRLSLHRASRMGQRLPTAPGLMRHLGTLTCSEVQALFQSNINWTITACWWNGWKFLCFFLCSTLWSLSHSHFFS